MANSVLSLSEVKLALKREELNFKIQNSELNGTEDSIIFIDRSSKTTLRGKVVRSFNEGEVHHWPLLSHQNVARLIDILRVRDDLYLYLTLHHEITLKNIVHDQNFIYDSACFDRKRLYARGIYSGLSYLHEKSLSLMNLCDDNIVISIADDTAIITNFDHLTCKRKATRSSLNIPEMYMAPETENGEFDSINAEMWASGILMLDMFLAHMVPWAIVGYRPKKVINIIDNMSLDLLQAANVGSVVTALDLAKFKTFLKCFFKQNPVERIPAKYAYIASFLKNRYKYKILTDSCESVSLTEDLLPLDYPNLISPLCFNSTYNSASNYTSPKAQKSEAERTDLSDVSTIEAQQSSIQMDKNEEKVDLSLTGTSKNSIKLEKGGNFPRTFDKIIASIADAEINDCLQKIPKSLETVYVGGKKAANELSYNCYQSKSLSFIKPTSDNITFSPVQSNSKNSDLGLNVLFNNNDNGDDGNENKSLSINANNDLIVEPDSMKAETNKKFSKPPQTRHMQSETKIVHRITYKLQNNTPIQMSEKPIVKPPRNSKIPPLLLSSDIKTVLNKITFLRKCYVSIHAHQKIFISNEFENKQKKFIKNYRNLLLQEDLRLRAMLIGKYNLKLEDVGKLMKYVNLGINGNQYEQLWMSQSFFKINENSPLQVREMKDAIKGDNDKYCLDNKFKNANVLTVKPERNYSYYKAIENAEKNKDRKLEINCQVHSEKTKIGWERTNVPENKFVTSLSEYNKKAKIEHIDVEMNEMVKYHENMGKYEKSINEVQHSRGARPKTAVNKDSNNKEKREELNTKGKAEKNPQNSVRNNKNMNEKLEIKKKKMKGNMDKKPDNKGSKKKKMNENMDENCRINKKKINRSMDKKSIINKKKVTENIDKKEKKLRDIQKLQEPKRPWWFNLCPGGRVEDPTPIADTLCETCKINLEMI